MYEYNAKVLRVVDGDTVDVEIDHGMHIKSVQRVRLYRVNAPERFTPEGKEATTFVRAMLEDEWVVVKTYKDRTEKYGRWLADISIDGDDIGDLLVIHGLAEYNVAAQ